MCCGCTEVLSAGLQFSGVQEETTPKLMGLRESPLRLATTPKVEYVDSMDFELESQDASASRPAAQRQLNCSLSEIRVERDMGPDQH